eukprot:TRINITY_DN1494_c0_g1_i1.p1 TRINITY_DN1494_c0_g1~~TRINITY_DN1494_c0_g1_i1.p1  ORF type:complete len:304 (-),score=46.36 TRINITY_DN1494_c0_g1_i1:64-975(-)
MRTMGYKEVIFPMKNRLPDQPGANVFLSSDALDAETLMVIINDCGHPVQAGEWSRNSCINGSLKTGSILPYLDKAKEKKFGVIVTNPNKNYAYLDNKPPSRTRSELMMINNNTRMLYYNVEKEKSYPKIPIKKSETPQAHLQYVWKHFIDKRAKASNIVIIAHAGGGCCTLQLLRDNIDSFNNRVCAIAFLGSAHYTWDDSSRVIEFLGNRCVNFVSSVEPLGTTIPDTELTKVSVCPVVSGGTPQGELLCSTVFESVFTFISDKLNVYSKTEETHEFNENQVFESSSTFNEMKSVGTVPNGE